MTPDQVLSSYRRSMATVGEQISVRRYSGTGAARTFVDTSTAARVVGYQPHELVGTIVLGDRKVLALVDTLADVLPLTTADKVVVRGRECAIKAVDDNTRRVAGVLIALELQVAG